jgi:hypothetical protein
MMTSGASMRRLRATTLGWGSGGIRESGNQVKLLEDAVENHPRWLEAIAGAKRRVLFEPA